MLPPTTINQATLDTILCRLALLFLTGAAGDPATARQAAAEMLAAYNAQTSEELSLAAEIISFSLHALEALSQAADPAMSLNRTLRLRGSAVSLSRESHKCQRKLDQLQRARQAGVPQQPPEVQPEPSLKLETAIALIKAGRLTKQIVARDGGNRWSQSVQKQKLTRRMTENLRKTHPTPPIVQTAALSSLPIA
jgi:hypothetical protein